MGLRVIGAGLGRTGTHSLKIALERLMGAPCYHMVAVFEHPEHVPLWHEAARGNPVDWGTVFDGYVATTDWPGGAFWPELTAAYPDAMVLLSTRDSAEEWWKSANDTIFVGMREGPRDENREWFAMMTEVIRSRFTDRLDDAEACMAAYERHNEAVRANVDPARLVEWRPSDGWGPLCGMLGVDVPDEPFPLTNTTEEFRARDRR
jgi:Sulfotransferase domain